MNGAPAILVVDDQASARDTLEAQLAMDAYALHFADGGPAALDRLREAPVDLVLCDVMMPGIDGLDVCRTIKAHPDWRMIPVILVTALDGRDDLVRGLEAGADDLLHKPVDRIVLRARVRAMLRIRRNYLRLHARTPDLDAMLRERRERLSTAAGLTTREREVLELLLLGRSHDDIAATLGISERTSKFHTANLLRKLGADSRTDLPRLFL